MSVIRRAARMFDEVVVAVVRAPQHKAESLFSADERIERAMAMLRAGSSVTDACMAVGFTSLGSFSSTFTRIAGETPSAYRAREHPGMEQLPSCITKVLARPMPFR